MESGDSSDVEFDAESQRFDDYSVSADVSESESSTSSASFSCRRQPPLPPTPPPPLKPRKPESEMSEVELMKDRFAKLLLGEDMCGGGKGVSTALAISNAITDLAAKVFGELWKLEPLTPGKKTAWGREMEWLLSVSDSIVELVPSMQESPNGGGTFEVMVPQPRSDLYINIPALKKLDAILVNMLDGFRDPGFCYVEQQIETCPRSSSSSLSSHMHSVRLQEEGGRLPFPKVPPDGLSEKTRNQLLQCRECATQIFKAALAINTTVLFEMEVPKAYLESLPKSGKECLGETLYNDISTGQLSPECLLDYLDLSSEYTASEIANRVETAMHIWRQKHHRKRKKKKKQLNPAKSGWGGTMKGLVGYSKEREKVLSERAESILRSMKLTLPGLRQTTLDMQKIQHNKDVGQSILESYSRVLESISFNLIARIDDLLYVDDAARRRAAAAAELISRRGHYPQRRVSSASVSYQQKPCAPLFRTDKASSSLVDTSSRRRRHNNMVVSKSGGNTKNCRY
ncbi:unnamed protein product [Cuscuta campestris]|uniref:PRONE domain-containing protein n=2 Tax=Cuscuta sect. Cleistogrammica TaxID=1824901 RepID=A0A484M5W5_9ASTE|nr:hypothetical protein DM860_015905 [Cuscuta australis]VFQ83997.1 unnamed protein product [Cuscuta campestris]